MAIDPVTAGLLAQGGMGLLSGLLGGRSQKRQDRQNDRRQAMGNLQQSLGGGNQRPVAGMGGRTPGVMEGMLSDPVTQQLLQQLMAGKGGQGGDLFKPTKAQIRKIMPEFRAYDDPEVEKTIQLIMQQSGVPRAEAIRMYKMLAQSPDTMGPRNQMSILGDAGGLRPHRSPVSGYPGDSGIDDAETEGIDSPTNPIVEQANQPKLAPGEERVVEDSAQQGDVDPITGMAQLMSGGQTVYGQPATKISKGENVAGILQALASAGQTYFGGRDIKAADKRGREGTARANLINALAGNIVAQAPRVTPSPGVATSMSKGLAKASSEFVRRREKQRALDQQAMMTKLTGQKPPTGKDPDSLKAAFKEDGARVGRSWGDKPEVEFYDNNTVKSQKNLSANLIRRLMQNPPNLRAGLIASFQEGYRTARERGADNRVADRAALS